MQASRGGAGAGSTGRASAGSTAGTSRSSAMAQHTFNAVKLGQQKASQNAGNARRGAVAITQNSGHAMNHWAANNAYRNLNR